MRPLGISASQASYRHRTTQIYGVAEKFPCWRKNPGKNLLTFSIVCDRMSQPITGLFFIVRFFDFSIYINTPERGFEQGKGENFL